MGVQHSSTDTTEEVILPAGGSFVVTDEVGTELFRVTALDDSVKVAGQTVTASKLSTLTSLAASAAELNRLEGATGTPLLSAKVAFNQTAGDGTYTGSVTVPAGATIHDIKVWSAALWNAGTSAAMDVGDAGDPNGWYASINLKATDLLVGEEINFENTGGKEGAYLVTASGTRSAAYSTSERVVSGVITQVGNGAAGQTYMEVVWSKPATADVTAAVKA